MKIAILSDSHDNWLNLKTAVKIAGDLDCETLLFAGDLVAPPTLDYLAAFKGPIHMVLGNNEGEIGGLVNRIAKQPHITLHGIAAGNYCEIEIAGKKIFMNHYPKIGRTAAETQKYDVVIYGHNHEYLVEKICKTLLINPGEIQGERTGKPSFVVLDLENMEAEKILL